MRKSKKALTEKMAKVVSLLKELYPNAEIDEFYSDLYCDTPLARLAKKAYIVKGEKLSPWKKY